MTLAAIWCAAFAAHVTVWKSFSDSRFVMNLYYGFIAGLPATAVATLFGQLRLGLLCGLASALAVLAIEFLSFI